MTYRRQLLLLLLGLVAQPALLAAAAPFLAPLPVAELDGASDLAAGDVDGDGDLDLATVGAAAGEVAWVENAGAAWTAHGLAYLDGTAVALGDVDGDGALDLVAASASRANLHWWSNTAGDGGSWTGADISTFALGVSDVALGDVDGDGDSDVLVGRSDSPSWFLTWCENTAGDGTAWSCGETEEDTHSRSFDVKSEIGIGDLDGDGDLDLVAYVDYWNSAGPFGVKWLENLWNDIGDVRWVAHDIVAELRIGRFEVVDIDRDGDADVVSAQLVGAPKLFRSDGAGGFTEETLGSSGGDVSIGDVDGDGDLDVATNRPRIVTGYTWLEQTAGGWLEHTIEAFPLGTGTRPRTVGAELADLDLDGDLDLVGSYVLLDDADGTTRVDGAYIWYENRLREAAPLWPRHELPFEPYANPVLTLEVEGDADPDVLAFDFTLLFAYRNVGATLEASVSGIAPASVAEGEETAVLGLDLVHRGRPGDRGAALSRLTVRFEDAAGQPLDQGALDALLGTLRLRRHDAGDALVAGWTAAAIDAGEAAFEVPAGLPDAVVACCGATASFQLTLEAAPGAGALLPSPFRISIPDAGMTAADDVDDLPVTVEDVAANEALVSLSGTSDLIFSDGFESGNTSAWSSAVLAAAAVRPVEVKAVEVKAGAEI